MKISELRVKKKQVIIMVILAVLLFLFLTNPSPQSFNAWSKENSGYRKYNFYLFSVYQITGDYYRNYYIGVAQSFFWIKKE